MVTNGKGVSANNRTTPMRLAALQAGSVAMEPPGGEPGLSIRSHGMTAIGAIAIVLACILVAALMMVILP